ncbi:hypothetical protein D3C79_827920 [compost metagenome]
MHDLLETRQLLLLPGAHQLAAVSLVHHLTAQLEQVIGDRAVDLGRIAPVHQQVVHHLVIVTFQRVQLGSLALVARRKITPSRRERRQYLCTSPLGMLTQTRHVFPLDGRQPKIPLMCIEQGQQQRGGINRKTGGKGVQQRDQSHSDHKRRLELEDRDSTWPKRQKRTYSIMFTGSRIAPSRLPCLG